MKLEDTGVQIRKLILKNISIGKRGSLANILEKSLESLRASQEKSDRARRNIGLSRELS